MLTIGVAGVTIPGAVDCINKINRASSLYYGGNEHPHVVLHQPNFGILQEAFKNDDWEKVLLELSKSVELLVQMGADFVIIPANTVHRVIADLQSSVPILNMLEVVSDACKEKNMKKVGILGTVWTMSGHLYKNSLEACGIEEVIPTDEEQKIIHASIFSEIIPTGTVRPETLEAMLTVVESLKRRGCEGIALACTELPLVLNQANCGIPVIDTTDALAQAAVKRTTSSRP
jgi:aspartate racemase